jgi:hypothetical protein
MGCGMDFYKVINMKWKKARAATRT